MKKILAISTIIASILCSLLLCSFSPISNGVETNAGTVVTLCASRSIPELGISEGEYYDIVVSNNGDRVIFQNLTNTIVCEAKGGMGHINVSSGSYSAYFMINRKYSKRIEFWFPSGRSISNTVPENPRQIMILWATGEYCYFK